MRLAETLVCLGLGLACLAAVLTALPIGEFLDGLDRIQIALAGVR